MKNSAYSWNDVIQELTSKENETVEINRGHENALQIIKPKIEDAFHAIEDGDIKYCKKLLSQVLELLN